MVAEMLMSQSRRILSIVALSVVYGLTIAIATVGGALIRRRSKRTHRIIINGTFHNPNWFFAHVEPITRSGYGEIILVSDVALDNLPNLKNVCPPRWALRMFTRAGAKAIWTLGMGIRYPADCHMGYHIFPAAVTSLICARLTGSAAAYQVTSGPLELEGGGWHAENKLLVALQRHSAWIERLALSIVRSFDLVVVRGSNAKRYIQDADYHNSLQVVTGSVEIDRRWDLDVRDIDILFIGRLTEYKRPDRFLNVVAEVAKEIPSVRACMIGDGPDRGDLERQARALGIAGNVEFAGQRSDITEFQGRARILLLTSRWEGVSIAMLESMGLGAVPVVSDVGDLRDFVRPGVTGYIHEQDDIRGFATSVIEVLKNEQIYQRMSFAARQLILDTAEKRVVAQRWREIFSDL